MQSTLILSRENGSIIRTSGLISNSSSANPNSTLPASGEATSESYTNGRKDSGIHSAEDVASSVWSFLTAAGSLVDELDKEDEVKLLRLRTKKNELVIVPGMNIARTTERQELIDNQIPSLYSSLFTIPLLLSALTQFTGYALFFSHKLYDTRLVE